MYLFLPHPDISDESFIYVERNNINYIHAAFKKKKKEFAIQSGKAFSSD